MMKILSLLTVCIICLSLFSVNAAENISEPSPVITFGFKGMFGTNNIILDVDDAEIEPGFITGGGVLIEKNLTNYFSAGSGIDYRYFSNDFVLVDENESGDVDANWKFTAIAVPLHFMLSIKGPQSSLDLIGGATYLHIISSIMKAKSTDSSEETEDDAMRLINASQVGFSGGLRFRFMVTDYSDLFIGLMAEYYPTNLLNTPEDDNIIHLLNYSFNAGYLFRTDLFNIQ